MTATYLIGSVFLSCSHCLFELWAALNKWKWKGKPWKDSRWLAKKEAHVLLKDRKCAFILTSLVISIQNNRCGKCGLETEASSTKNHVITRHQVKENLAHYFYFFHLFSFCFFFFVLQKWFLFIFFIVFNEFVWYCFIFCFKSVKQRVSLK